ncbi:MAG: oxaloacetate decarboxylase subunit alpha [Chloroflexota bacterium]|nr:MAG: oxaloacetate decarboxylase subunit alpha [Chloroflexota bacterium]
MVNVKQVKPVGITDTILRDAHQSLLATRMRTEDMLPVAEKLDGMGFHSLEVWGGATFDTTYRFLDEDPWERLRTLKKHIKKTPLQMLLRGQNVVGYRHYADDVVEAFVTKAYENGMDIFRIFDALNDVRNMETAMRVTKRVGGHVQATICYTISPLHTNDGFVAMARQLAEMGADSICIKDMAGLLAPYDAYDLVSKMKAEIDLPIQLHSHYTSGMASVSYLKAIEAGVDVVDTAISTLSLGTSQPPTEALVAALRGTPRDPGLDLGQLSEVAKYFAGVRKRYRAFEGELMGVDTDVLTYQVPGGMISNLVSQLREQNALDRLAEVLQEVPRVRADLGYPPLVTPSSQFVGTQAVINVVVGERYKVVPKEIRAYVKGMYGRPPGSIDPEAREKILGSEESIDCRPADLLEPELEKAAAELDGLARAQEDVISYALFPQVVKEYLERQSVCGENQREREIVAAIAAVLAQQTNGKQVSPASGATRTRGITAWRLASRGQTMRGSGWR